MSTNDDSPPDYFELFPEYTVWTRCHMFISYLDSNEETFKKVTTTSNRKYFDLPLNIWDNEVFWRLLYEGCMECYTYSFYSPLNTIEIRYNNSTNVTSFIIDIQTVFGQLQQLRSDFTILSPIISSIILLFDPLKMFSD